MQRTLVLVRHAKSSWDDSALADHDRPLAPRGVKALDRMREHIAALELGSVRVWCSSARRALDTFEGVRAALPDDAVVVVDRSIYDANAEALLAHLHDVDDDVERVMVVGHNPTIQDLAIHLAGSGDHDARHQLVTKLPTGAIVTLSFDGQWQDLAKGTANLDTLFTPRRPRPSV